MPRKALIIGLLILISCTRRGEITMDEAAASVGTVENVFIGTTRARDPDGGFGTHRSEQIHFARFDISVPPERKLGEISWPRRGAQGNPQTQFLTTNAMVYPSGQAFRADLRRQLAAKDGEAVIFIHGYNTNFAEGLYRVAQFTHDLELPGVALQYAWPSAAEPLGYAYDRDSALFAREGLEELIHEVGAAGAKRILLVAHSLGGGLTMEALRSAAIRGDRKTLALIGGVILISPDIDVEVFREQARAVGTLPQPFVIFGSDRDKFLRLSAMLTGQEARLGSLSDVSRLADLKVTFADVSSFSTGLGHFVVGDSAALIRLFDRIGDIQTAFEADRRSRLSLLSGVVLTVQSATQIILTPIGRVATQFTQ